MPLKAWVKMALDRVVQACLKQPDLEFAWVGDDAVDPMQQAQTIAILVNAGIKTCDEARAELGLAGAKGVAKYNHNHDELGRFTTGDEAGGAGAGTQVAQNERGPTMTDIGGGNPKPSSSPTAAAEGLTQTAATTAPVTIAHEAPKGAVEFKSGDGVTFLSRIIQPSRRGAEKSRFTRAGFVRYSDDGHVSAAPAV